MPNEAHEGTAASLPEGLKRRDFLSYFSGIGLTGTLLPGVLWSRFQEEGEITPQNLAEAEKIAGLEFTEEEREAMVRGLNGNPGFNRLACHSVWRLRVAAHLWAGEPGGGHGSILEHGQAGPHLSHFRR